MKIRTFLGIMAIACIGMATQITALAKTEGDGYSSAKEAAQAYMEAFVDNDLEAMEKTFAIETYAENYKLAEMVGKNKSWMPFLDLPVPQYTPYAQKLMVMNRRSRIESVLTNQYIMYSYKDGEYIGSPIQLNEEEVQNPDKFLQDHFGVPFWIENKIENIQVLTAEEYSETPVNYFNPNTIEIIEKKRRTLNADKIEELICTFSAGNQSGVQFLSLASYNNKWYVISPGSTTIDALMGIQTYCGGLIYGGVE